MGLDTIFYRGPQLWNLVPQEIKESTSFLIFKHKIKKWNCKNCPCRLCRTFLFNLVLYEKYFDSWVSYIYINKHRCRGVDGIRPTHRMGFFSKIVKGFKPLTVFAESSVFGVSLVLAMFLYSLVSRCKLVFNYSCNRG